MLLVYIVRELRILGIMNLPWRTSLLVGCHVFWSKTHLADHITGRSDNIWGRSSWFYWTFFNPGWVLGNKETVNAVEANILTWSIVGQVRFILFNIALVFFVFQKVVGLLFANGSHQQWKGIIKTVTKGYKGQNIQENGRCFVSSEQCSITRPCFQWLLC